MELLGDVDGKQGNLLKRKKHGYRSLRIKPCDKCLDQLERERDVLRELLNKELWEV